MSIEPLSRPDPDAILRRVEAAEAKHGRARLKIYFGFAPGVGKTFAMLEAARRLRARGADVVVGCVETHGRPETAALLEGLEVLPRREVPHRGVVLGELDLDRALARRPAVLLVDELAHTNAPGLRHAKRWQDVLDLLDEGIEVHATLNVQHVESLNDVVAQITTVRVRETVPDAILERADEIELIDLPAEDLLARLQEGKVYLPEQAERARENFFRRGNLLALREIALRRTADLVDVDVRAYREEHGIGVTWPAGERVLVGVGPSPSSSRLIRSARRMAEGLRAPWTAVWVDGATPLGAADRERLEAHLRLAESLGGEIARLSGDRPAEAILAFARRHNATRLIVGKPTHSRIRDLLRGSFLDELVRRSGGVDVHVIAGGRPEPHEHEPEEPRGGATWPDYVWAAEIVAVGTGAAALVDRFLALPDVAMVFLVAIMIAAARAGRGPSVFAAALSVAAYDFFFVPPRFTFAVSDSRHVLTFVMMFVVGFVLSEMNRRVRTKEKDARSREANTAALYALAKDLGAAANAESVARAIALRAAEAFDGGVVVLLPDPEGALVEAARSGEAVLDARDLGVARWAHEHGRVAGLGTETLPGSRASCVPLRAEERPLGVIVFLPHAPGRALDQEQRRLLEALAQQGALAIERATLANDAEAAQLRARTEEMRSSLLSTVSHDLRTLLAAIEGAASALREGAPRLEPAARGELVETIYEESVRLERLVGNLLEMTRVESGSIEVKRDWVPIDEIVGSALNRLESLLGARPLTTSIADDLPLVSCDSALLEQVLVNLLDNAIKHTPAGVPIELRAHATPESIVLEVADRGPGLRPGDEEMIFQKFRRGAGTIASGAGLGLAICRGIVEAHGGTIRARARDRGGAVFTVVLPRAPGEPS